jgi:predicted nucleic acid-binding protein
MSYLLDTCMLVEFAQRKPEMKVIRWINSVDQNELFVSVISIGEIQRGIIRLPDSQHRTLLLAWVSRGLVERLKDHTLPLDTETLVIWGSLTARKNGTGQPMGTLESLIVALALRHNMTLVTHFAQEYFQSGASVLNPWE